MSKVIVEVTLDNISQSDLKVLREKIEFAVDTYLTHESTCDTESEDWTIEQIFSTYK